MADFTKGEWAVSYGGEIDGYEKYAVTTDTEQICLLRVKKDPKEIEANAFLIASAPDMYEALKDVQAGIDHWTLRKRIDLALAKAEGKEEK